MYKIKGKLESLKSGEDGGKRESGIQCPSMRQLHYSCDGRMLLCRKLIMIVCEEMVTQNDCCEGCRIE